MRILNAQKLFGHRCWRYTPAERREGVVETYRGCQCGPPYLHLTVVEAITIARYWTGEIDREQLMLVFGDEGNKPEEPLTADE